MTPQLFIFGLNIIVISLFLALYGLMSGVNSLIGVASSLGVLGGVFIVYSRIPRDPTITALVNYSKILLESTTSIIEDLDLLDSNLCIVRKGNELLAVYSKIPCPIQVDPGVGFTGGSPYLAIPIEIPLVEGFEATGTVDQAILERMLRTIIVDELGMARELGLTITGNTYHVYIHGLIEVLKDYSKYPVDPYVIVTAAIIAYTTSASSIRVVEKTTTPDGVVIALRAGEIAE